MDPFTAIVIGFLVLSGAVHVGVKATADSYATVKAAQSGKFDFIDADRRRRATQREKVAAAWAERRKARAKQAGDVGGAYRPGAREYGRDLYHGFWEDRLDHRGKKRAARPEWQYDSDAKPWHVRFDDAVTGKVSRIRESRGWDKAKAAGRRLVDPVGEKPTQPIEEQVAAVRDEAERADPDFYGHDEAATDQTEQQEQLEQGDTEMTEPTETAAVAGEVNNNEDARRVFQEQIDAANAAAEALAVYEAAQARLSAVATSGMEGLHAKRFDKQAQEAQGNAADLLPETAMGGAAQAIEGIRASAEEGLAALEKYRDSEDLVNSNNVDGRTLETAGSA